MGRIRDELEAGRAQQEAREAGMPGVPGLSPTPRVVPVIVRLADVAPEAITWVWPGRLAAGKITLLVGDPGLGKSWITCDVAARASSGRLWPDGTPALSPCNVLMLSAEDGLADTIRPRLDALGADVGRVHHLAVLRCGEAERSVQLADLDGIEAALEQTHARVLMIDPIAAYTGRVDTHRDAEVRGLLAPLAALAERHRVAVLGVMHLGKSAQRPALYRAAGSIAFAAAARVVLAVAADPAQPDRRIVAPIKSNLSRPPAALAYTLADGRLAWEGAPVTIDVEALLAGPPTARDRDEQTDAEAVLADLLADAAGWPMEARTALQAGAAHGIHERTMQRTARQIGIRITRVGFGRDGRWLWHRPVEPAAIDDSMPDIPAQGIPVSSMSPMGVQAQIGDIHTIDDKKNAFPRAGAKSNRGANGEQY